MSQNQDISNQLFMAVETLIDKKFEQVKFDETIPCIVMNKVENEDNLYKVKYNDNIIYQALAKEGEEYSDGDQVYVNIPYGNYNRNNKIILGKYEKLQEESLTYEDPFDHFVIDKTHYISAPSSEEQPITLNFSPAVDKQSFILDSRHWSTFDQTTLSGWDFMGLQLGITTKDTNEPWLVAVELLQDQGGSYYPFFPQEIDQFLPAEKISPYFISSTEIYGNVTNLKPIFKQKKLFNFPTAIQLSNIDAIGVTIYNLGNTTGSLQVNDIELTFGYDVKRYIDKPLHLYVEGNFHNTFTYKDTQYVNGNLEKPNISALLIDQETKTIQTELSDKQILRWYEYEIGEVGDSYGGGYWKYLGDQFNKELILPAVYDSKAVYQLDLDKPYSKIKAVLCEGSNKYLVNENLVGYKVIDQRKTIPGQVLDEDKEQILLIDDVYYECIFDESADVWKWSPIDLGGLSFHNYWLKRIYDEWEKGTAFLDKNYINKLYTFHYVKNNSEYLNTDYYQYLGVETWQLIANIEDMIYTVKATSDPFVFTNIFTEKLNTKDEFYISADKAYLPFYNDTGLIGKDTDNQILLTALRRDTTEQPKSQEDFNKLWEKIKPVHIKWEIETPGMGLINQIYFVDDSPPAIDAEELTTKLEKPDEKEEILSLKHFQIFVQPKNIPYNDVLGSAAANKIKCTINGEYTATIGLSFNKLNSQGTNFSFKIEPIPNEEDNNSLFLRNVQGHSQKFKAILMTADGINIDLSTAANANKYELSWSWDQNTTYFGFKEDIENGTFLTSIEKPKEALAPDSIFLDNISYYQISEENGDYAIKIANESLNTIKEKQQGYCDAVDQKESNYIEYSNNMPEGQKNEVVITIQKPFSKENSGLNNIEIQDDYIPVTYYSDLRKQYVYFSPTEGAWYANLFDSYAEDEELPDTWPSSDQDEIWSDPTGTGIEVIRQDESWPGEDDYGNINPAISFEKAMNIVISERSPTNITGIDYARTIIRVPIYYLTNELNYYNYFYTAVTANHVNQNILKATCKVQALYNTYNTAIGSKTTTRSIVLEAYYPIAIQSQPENATWTMFSGNPILTWNNNGETVDNENNEFNLYKADSDVPEDNITWTIIPGDQDKYEFVNNILTFKEGKSSFSHQKKIYTIMGTKADAFIQVPIKSTISQYNIDLTNSWAGKVVSIDNSAATVMATAIGAGEKDFQNTFTGVLMGTFMTLDDQILKGLYGFQKDIPTFGINALTGDAFFKGHVEALSGKIGGWTIAPYSIGTQGRATYNSGIYADQPIDADGYFIRTGIKLSAKATDNAFYVTKLNESLTESQTIFGVQHDGTVIANRILINAKFNTETNINTGTSLVTFPISKTETTLTFGSADGKPTSTVYWFDGANNKRAFYGHIITNISSYKHGSIVYAENSKAYLYMGYSIPITEWVPPGLGGTNSSQSLYGWKLAANNYMLQGQEFNIMARGMPNGLYISCLPGPGYFTPKISTGTTYSYVWTDKSPAKITIHASPYQTNSNYGARMIMESIERIENGKTNIEGHTRIRLRTASIKNNPYQPNDLEYDNMYIEGLRGYLNYTWSSQSEIAINSDLNKKYSIQDLPLNYSQLFDLLHPVIYKYKNGTSNRYHSGLIAQEVEQALKDTGIAITDFAGLVIDDITQSYSLRYGEFIALCIAEIQQLKAQVQELKKEKKEK